MPVHRLLKHKWEGDPVLPPCSPPSCRLCPVGSEPIRLKQGWSQVKAELLALVQNPLHFSTAPQAVVTMQLQKA